MRRLSGRTGNLLVQPLVRGSRQFLIGGAIGEGVGYRDVPEVLENGALHSQLVEIGIEEGDDTLRIG